MSKVRAHITVDEEKSKKADSRAEILNKLKRAAKMTDINEKRFELYGVLTATVDDSELEKVRKIPGVTGVELDQQKFLQ